MKVCQVCGKHPATTHIKQNINGHVTEMYVCSHCAASKGVGFVGNELTVGNMFSGLFAQPILRTFDHAITCPTCGSTYPVIVRRGRVGCPDCYTMFYDQLYPSIQRIHGKSVHVGKTVKEVSAPVVDELDRLKQELTKAVETQEFERCAQLRDRIKEWEANEHE